MERFLASTPTGLGSDSCTLYRQTKGFFPKPPCCYRVTRFSERLQVCFESIQTAADFEFFILSRSLWTVRAYMPVCFWLGTGFLGPQQVGEVTTTERCLP